MNWQWLNHHLGQNELTFIKQILYLSTTLDYETHCAKDFLGVRTSEWGYGGQNHSHMILIP